MRGLAGTEEMRVTSRMLDSVERRRGPVFLLGSATDDSRGELSS